ncbi:hypothetical protein, partial [Geobacillus stearothermophilus]|uniref:hypothetical protein n=1 Tax=Geobacillus stearothermophilus TaxID=1422 RepID=UPI002E1DB5E0|nr:hypothetical protein [Geobacillus stearothermophilus]
QSRNFVPFGKIYKNQRGLTPKVRFLADFWVSPFFFILAARESYSSPFFQSLTRLCQTSPFGCLVENEAAAMYNEEVWEKRRNHLQSRLHTSIISNVGL